MAHIIHTPKVDIDPQLLAEMQTSIHELGQVVVHCVFRDPTGGNAIRIWKSTYLYDHFSNHASGLTHAEKITIYPQWQITRPGDNFFTLIFTGLPDDCAMFDLIENCNGRSGAFEVFDIMRNASDIYYVQFA